MGYLYLASALVAWAAIAFVYRHAEKRGVNRFWMAAAIGLGSLLCNLATACFCHVNILAGHPSQFIVGGIAGLLNVLAVPFFLAAVGHGDLSITWLVVMLSFAPASALSLLYPGGKATAVGFIGLLTAVVAVALLGLDTATRSKISAPRKGWFLFTGLAFAANALATFTFTLSASLSPDASAAHRLAFLSTLAGTLVLGGSLLAFYAKSQGARLPALTHGLLAGCASFAGCYFTLLAIKSGGIPDYIVYPIGNGGSNVLVVALSVILLKERPGRYGWTGIAGGTLALILLGLAAA